MFHNDWITYDYKNLTINEYPNKDFIPTTFQDALIRQAKAIYSDVKPTVFLSGGIDSQAIALGFILAELEVEYVYIRLSFCNYYVFACYWKSDNLVFNGVISEKICHK